MSTPPVDFDVELPLGIRYALVSCVLEEGLSKLTHAKVEIRCPEAIDAAAIIRQKVGITIHLFERETRRWTLQVSKVTAVGVEGDTFRYVVELYAFPWLQLLTRNTRKFRRWTAHEIISRVLAEGAIPFVWKTTRPTPRRNYCIQYRESNWDFVQRLLEFEGIFYRFDETGSLCLEDQSLVCAPVAGDPHVELQEASGIMGRAKLGVHEISRGARIQSGTATVNDYNWKTPDVDLLQTASADKDYNLEVYEYPAGYRKEADGAYLAQIRLEALRVGSDYLTGRGDVVTFEAGRTFEFGGEAGADFAGEYLLVGVEHKLRKVQPDQAAYLVEADVTYENHFEAIPRTQVFRPEVKTPRPTILGNHTVMVRGPEGEEIHTDERARFKAQFHWDREAVETDEDSRWLRMLQESGSSMFLARIGWEMNVAYVDGDPDRPIGLARDINGVMIPAYGQPDKKNRMTIKTPSSPATGGFNEIKLDDTAGDQLFYIQAEKDMNIRVQNDRLEQVGRDETHYVTNGRTHTVERDQTTVIGRHQNRSLSSSQFSTVQGNRSFSVGGSEEIKTGGVRTNEVSKNEMETVGAVKLTVAGIPTLPTVADLASQAQGKVMSIGQNALDAGMKSLMSAGDVGAAATAISGSLSGAMGSMSAFAGSLSSMTPSSVASGAMAQMQGFIARSGELMLLRMIGGAYITVGIGSINTSMNGYLEMVGGVHLTVTADNAIQESVIGPLTTMVGGAIIKMSDMAMGIGAQKTKVNVGALAKWSSDTEMKLESGGEIVLEAKTGLTFEAGGSVFEILPDKVVVKGNAEFSAGDSVEYIGNKDNVTGGGGGGAPAAPPAEEPPPAPEAPDNEAIHDTPYKNVKVQGSPEFREKALADLETIASTPKGKALLDRIGESGHEVLLTDPDLNDEVRTAFAESGDHAAAQGDFMDAYPHLEGATPADATHALIDDSTNPPTFMYLKVDETKPGPGTDSRIVYDPDGWPNPDMGAPTITSDEVLVHELDHATRMTEGGSMAGLTKYEGDDAAALDDFYNHNRNEDERMATETGDLYLEQRGKDTRRGEYMNGLY